jgi:hypothetical protein
MVKYGLQWCGSIERKRKMKIEIEMASEVMVQSRGVVVTLDMEKLGADVIAKAVAHGFKQKIADAAAGAKGYAEENELDVANATEILMTKAVENLMQNGWTGGGGGSTRDPLKGHVVRIVRQLLDLGKAPDEAKADYEKLGSAKEKNEFAWEFIQGHGNEEAIRKKAQEMYDDDQRLKAERAKLAAGLDL